MPRAREQIILDIRETCKSKKDIKLVRQELDNLISELKISTNYPEIQISYPVEKVEGAWRQLWTDQEYPIRLLLDKK